MLFNAIQGLINRRKIRKLWRKRNSHNKTYMKNIFPHEHVSVGRATYGELNVVDFSADEGSALKIGAYVSIANNVSFILNGEHNIRMLSTYPYRVQIVQDVKYEATSKGDIIIKDDVWLGNGATVMSGVTVGQGAIVAAGAVVVSDVPPYAIAGGVPAKVIKYRFNQEVIDFLLTFDYSSLTEELVRNHWQALYMPIDDVDDIKSRFGWFPRKITDEYLPSL